MTDAFMLDSGRGKHRLEKTKGKGFLKSIFKNERCRGLPQRLLATISCLGSFKDEGLQGSTHSRVAWRL